eukprot:m.59711 g.59711  ORF g.59711 m.59711 type:complete len:55 (+) comp13605_c0_seq2:71-235(+)
MARMSDRYVSLRWAAICAVGVGAFILAKVDIDRKKAEAQRREREEKAVAKPKAS